MLHVVGTRQRRLRPVVLRVLWFSACLCFVRVIFAIKPDLSTLFATFFLEHLFNLYSRKATTFYSFLSLNGEDI